nr:penicillin-binding transpeptidase domain-containing protein [uncultured Gemmiger sp.]
MSLRRLYSLCSVLAVLCAAILCRVYWIGTDTAYAASAGGQSLSETALPRRRGNFYDRDGRQLTGTEPRWYALCIPGDSSYATLFPYVSFAAQSELYEKRNSMTPFLVEVSTDLSANGVYTYADAQRYLPNPIARHLIGYLNGEGVGVSGLELAYDDLLAQAGDEQTVLCTTTAQGSLMTGTQPEISRTSGTQQGVQLTLDANLQRACEGIAAQSMERGCIVVMETATGDVLASVSMPEFDPEDLVKSIQADDTSLINRPLSAFSAGSVFKVVLAAAAYQAGYSWFTHDCTGSVEVGDQVFRCAEGRAHGQVNLRGALEQSCNCYFIELGQLLGGERILQMARQLGFGQATAVAPGLKSAEGNLPQASAVADADGGQLAMLSFGQGALTVTPLQITAMMNTVADNGTWKAPRFVKGIVDAETMQLVQPMETAEDVPVCDADTAAILRSMLTSVVENGIGREAAPDVGLAGGKTGTAQTGQYDESGEELLNYWFSGFWPADAPRYTVTVLQDTTREPETSSAALFARVVNAIAVLDGQNTAETAENLSFDG